MRTHRSSPSQSSVIDMAVMTATYVMACRHVLTVWAICITDISSVVKKVLVVVFFVSMVENLAILLTITHTFITCLSARNTLMGVLIAFRRYDGVTIVQCI
jgi:hypothetical protein